MDGNSLCNQPGQAFVLRSAPGFQALLFRIPTAVARTLRHLQIAIEMHTLAGFEKHRRLAPRNRVFAKYADAFAVLPLFSGARCCVGYTGSVRDVSEFEIAVGRHRSCTSRVLRGSSGRNLQP